MEERPGQTIGKVAALTMAFDEAFLLPTWIHHYGKAVGHRNLFVIDDGSADGSTTGIPLVNVARKPRGTLDELDRARLVTEVHRRLLDRYEVVIFSDVDELVVLDPRLGQRLDRYLVDTPFDFRNVAGFDVLHDVEREAEITLERPLFEQRRFVMFNYIYSKPLVGRVRMDWVPGFHSVTRGPGPRDPGGARPGQPDPNLLMFHLRAMDISASRHRIAQLNTVQLSQASLRRNESRHFAWDKATYLAQFYSTGRAAFDAAYPNIDIVQRMLLSGFVPPSLVYRVPDFLRGSIELTAILPTAADGRTDDTGIDFQTLLDQSIADVAGAAGS